MVELGRQKIRNAYVWISVSEHDGRFYARFSEKDDVTMASRLSAPTLVSLKQQVSIALKKAHKPIALKVSLVDPNNGRMQRVTFKGRHANGNFMIQRSDGSSEQFSRGWNRDLMLPWSPEDEAEFEQLRAAHEKAERAYDKYLDKMRDRYAIPGGIGEAVDAEIAKVADDPGEEIPDPLDGDPRTQPKKRGRR